MDSFEADENYVKRRGGGGGSMSSPAASGSDSGSGSGSASASGSTTGSKTVTISENFAKQLEQRFVEDERRYRSAQNIRNFIIVSLLCICSALFSSAGDGPACLFGTTTNVYDQAELSVVPTNPELISRLIERQKQERQSTLQENLPINKRFVHQFPKLRDQMTIHDFKTIQSSYEWQLITTLPENEPPLPEIRDYINGIVYNKRSSDVKDVRDVAAKDVTHPLYNCPPTGQVKIFQPTMKKDGKSPPSGSKEPPFWLLQAYDDRGQPKTIGGDEFYITYIDAAMEKFMRVKYADKSELVDRVTAAAYVEDYGNGWYKVSFIASFLNFGRNKETVVAGRGKLNVHLLYTCNIGRYTPPKKEKWLNSAATVNKFTIEHDITAPTIHTPWEDVNRNEDGKRIVDLSTYEYVIKLGDSVLNQWAENAMWFPLRRGNTQVPYNTTNIPFILNTLETDFGVKLRRLMNGEINKMALIIGSSTWDVVHGSATSKDWNDHRAMIKLLLTMIRTKYPNLTIYWKSATALHVHIPSFYFLAKQYISEINDLDVHANLGFMNRSKYMSESRSRDIYFHQLDVMKELNIPVIDQYLMSYVSAEHTLPDDGPHYGDWLNVKMMEVWSSIVVTPGKPGVPKMVN